MKDGIRTIQQLTWGVTLAFLFGAQFAQADLISFDDFDASEGSASEQGYAGFTWDDNWQIGSSSTSGFGDSATSGTGFLTNVLHSNNLIIGRADPFDFVGAWLGAKSGRTGTGLIYLTAFDLDGNQIGERISQRVSSDPVKVQANFSGVSRLVIDPYGGILTLDDFEYRNIETSVNEAGGFALVLIGLAGLWAARRRLH